MAKNSIDAYGARGKTNLLMFDPDDLEIVTDPEHALYDERVHLPLDESMVLSIMALGVVQPINITKDPETGKTLVAAGRQRVRAAREANRRLKSEGRPPIQIPAYPRRGTTADLMGVMVAENEIRKDDTPIGRARKMARLMDRGRSVAEVALLFGVTEQTVRNNLVLLDCCADVRNAVESGSLGAEHARKLVKLTPDEQREKAKALIEAGRGVAPREKARRQRAIATGNTAPRMRSRAEVAAKLKAPDLPPGWADALRWVTYA